MELVPKVYFLPLDQIRPDPDQPRKEFDAQSIKDLAGSLKEHGQLTPINVRPGENGTYIIVAGERRWRAAPLAGLETLMCLVDTQERTGANVRVLALVENCQREDLKPMELAHAYRAAMEEGKWTGKELAKQLSKSPALVAMTLALLDLPEDLQAKVADGSLSAAAAYELSKLHNEREQREAAEEIIEGEMSRDEARAAVDARRGKAKKKIARYTEKLPAKGWTVTVTAPRTKPLTEAEVVDVLSSYLASVREKAREEAA